MIDYSHKILSTSTFIDDKREVFLILVDITSS